MNLNRKVKPLPHDLEAERAILGILITEPLKISEVIGLLKPSDFFSREHRMLFEGISSLYNENGGREDFYIDYITLKNKILELEGGKFTLGVDLFSELTESAATPYNLKNYIELIKKKSLLREIISLSQKMEDDSYSLKEPSEIISEAEDILFQLSMEKEKSEIVKIGDEALSALEDIKEKAKTKSLVTGVATGFEKLDLLTSGFHPGELIILAARPSMGKTSLALDIARNSANSGRTVVFFSLEMSKRQITLRLISSITKIEYKKLRTGYVSTSSGTEMHSLNNAVKKLLDLNLFVDDTSGISILELKSKLKRLVIREKKKIDLVIVDYLQLMQGDKDYKVREQEISYISRGLKSIAKEFEVPVLALSQLNRSPEIRTRDHRPQLSDLRESGSIEQDADIVMFIYRPDKYGDESNKGVAELIIGKNRNGELGKIDLAFIEKYASFTERVVEEDFVS